MTWGIFKKNKDGFKKGAQWLGNNVLKPIVNVVAPVPDQIKPGAGTSMKAGVDMLTGMTIGNGQSAIKNFVNNPKIRYAVMVKLGLLRLVD